MTLSPVTSECSLADPDGVESTSGPWRCLRVSLQARPSRQSIPRPVHFFSGNACDWSLMGLMHTHRPVLGTPHSPGSRFSPQPQRKPPLSPASWQISHQFLFLPRPRPPQVIPTQRRSSFPPNPSLQLSIINPPAPDISLLEACSERKKEKTH